MYFFFMPSFVKLLTEKIYSQFYNVINVKIFIFEFSYFYYLSMIND